MVRKFNSPSLDLAQTDPGLGILRLAALFADADAKLERETLDAMFEQVEAGVLAGAAPANMWPELVRGLMAPAPSRMIQALRECGALAVVLPEVAALSGVPQIADDPVGVDLGDHVLKALDEAARRGAPLAARFALLVMNVGKADSPPEHLPAHYRHIERGRPRIEAICDRFATPQACRELALLALAECERVHRVSEVRAGPVAVMLERLGAFDAPDLFDLLMIVCSCDYRAYGGRSEHDYPKAALLQTALEACSRADTTTIDPGLGADQALGALQTARAEAIARTFRSQRWSGGSTEP
ncbi:tRNA nucleotidyltransferase [Methylocapsa palsarum]|uniref:tRNA nucleotidyltransferase (CCA-adding enzyme) n=1 Tax=Methylocapsa palsarum TaxID=1612308 RepID=A0A1I3XZH6_9HYPH|nr:tRNA nucleotidyltransferase [Methylocapsa palsarum]SFK25047.1 tRNA nucleotidyltransferase (CCA-adding enzyme) [Methylocapsa palsarum]